MTLSWSGESGLCKVSDVYISATMSSPDIFVTLTMAKLENKLAGNARHEATRMLAHPSSPTVSLPPLRHFQVRRVQYHVFTGRKLLLSQTTWTCAKSGPLTSELSCTVQIMLAYLLLSVGRTPGINLTWAVKILLLSCCMLLQCLLVNVTVIVIMFAGVRVSSGSSSRDDRHAGQSGKLFQQWN